MDKIPKIVLSKSQMTCMTVIEKCRENDPDGWLAFYQPYRDYARNYIQNKYPTLSPTDCDDIAQDVMIHVATSIRKFDPKMPSRHNPGQRAKFRNWFYWQIRTVMQEHWRECERMKKEREMLSEVPDCMNGNLAKFDAAFHEAREKAIRDKAMEMLTRGRTKKRNIEAFQMMLNGRKAADIAKELDMSEDLVHQAVSRCRRFLAKRQKDLQITI